MPNHTWITHTSLSGRVRHLTPDEALTEIRNGRARVLVGQNAIEETDDGRRYAIRALESDGATVLQWEPTEWRNPR